MRCLQSGEVRGNGVEQLHGAVFTWLKERNPAAATRLHEEAEKGFVMTPIESSASLTRKNGFLQLEKGGLYQFCLNSLNEFTCELFTDLCQWLTQRVFHLHNAYLQIESAHSLNKPLTYEELLEASLSSLADKHWTLEFLTPTSFRRHGKQELFPLPELVYGSLLRRWNQHSTSPFPGGSEHEFQKLLMTRYNLQTELLAFSTYKVVGCKGKASYALPPDGSPYLNVQVAVLNKFASFAGVGYKTTMGMGMVRVTGKD